MKKIKNERKEYLMKNFKKIMALAIASVMVVGTVAIAAPGDAINPAEDTITVEGLGAGDEAYYYQIVVEDQVNPQNQGWDVIQALKDKNIAIASILDGISSAEASAIAAALTAANAQGTQMSVSNGTATATGLAPGVYYVAAIPADSNDYVYNPIFVSADYYEDVTDTWKIDTSYSYTDKVVAKKTPVTIHKDFDVPNPDKPYKDFAPGDEIEFEVKTNIPTFTDAYTDKEFYITDILDPGLSLKANTLTVAVAGYSDAEVAANSTKRENAKVDGSTINGYSVEFSKAFLGAVLGNPQVTITYTGVISDDEAFLKTLGNVKEIDNTVELHFTHKYDGTPKELTKITRHYTFGLDASLLGQSGLYEEYNTEDLVKVGQDANGDPIYVSHTKKRTVDRGKTTLAALEQCTFELDAYSGDCLNSKTTHWDITTNSLGELNVVGLDAGIYTLKETSAPAGWIIDTVTHYVQIDPHYALDADQIPYLLGYDILWGDDPANLKPVKSYTMTNDNNTKKLIGIHNSHIQGSDTQIVNKQGKQLPATGGVGTTMFYAIGAVLVLGAGILLVTKRRMSAY
jgi:fimbrial isopeptide formation D2 family protein/LPXTG-motif cell wall-anchored protein